uniref:Integrase catalytic domain-containing protein n=1 Tax=Fagus sylvatica TaxID=28930 RepID=A0A2N9EU18_FAGSY
MSDVADLLKQEREKNAKEPRHFVRKPPYPVELLNQPYPEKYVVPTFSHFDGRKGSALVHISKFIDSMGAYAGNGDLCLREFSKSLDDRAYIWYTTLPPGSVKTWEDMVELFCGKYFQVEEKITLVNLHTTKQASGEYLLHYIHRFHDISLDCYANYEEGELVGVYIDNMLPKFRAHLENLNISRFVQLLQKARKTALSVKPYTEKPKEKKSQPQVLTVSTVNNKRKKSSERSFEEPPPPVPFTLEEMIAILNRWIARLFEGNFMRRFKTEPWNSLKRSKSASDVDMDELAAASTAMTPAAIKTLQRKPKFRSLFNQLGLSPEDCTAATEAIMAIAAESDHRRPFYLSATINVVQVRRALVDTGSCINLIPLNTIQAAEISQKKIQGAPMEIKGFGGMGEYTKGHIQLVLKLVSSTYHQCVKGRLNEKLIRIAANPMPFDHSESHFVEAALYDEVAPAGEASLAKPVGIPLPKWEEIKDASEADLKDLLELKRKRREEASTSKKAPEPEEGILQPSCLIVNEASGPESADAATIQKKNSSGTTYKNLSSGGRNSITQEVKKLLAAGFIKPIQHPRWLSNIVPVKKKNGQIQCCVDFCNLNKACPKDEFPLPNIDLLIDSVVGHAMFSFMDGFSGYNQIFMSPKDAEKTAFRTPIGNFYYTVMPFGLKNAGATYQRTMTTMFHDMMHCAIEDYVDDIVVKSKTREDHFDILKKVFERCRLYKLKMNPLKCAFGVSAGKFLGFFVHQHGIDVDPARASAIATMKPPTTHKELKSFLGKLSYIRRFILGLAAVTSAFSPLLKKGAPFHWSTECQQAFKKLLQYEIVTKTPTAIKSQAIVDLLAQFLGEDSSFISDEVLEEINEVFLTSLADSTWTLRFDGSSTVTSVGADIVLYNDNGEAITKSFKFDFPCSNNATEYEAYLAGLAIAYKMGIKHFIEEAKEKLLDVHEKTCGDGGAISLYRRLQRLGYFWPSMSAEAANLQSQCLTCQFYHDNEEKDAENFVKTCHTYQVQANLIHTHPTSLQNMATPWLFHTWGLDLIGPINLASGGYIWIFVVIEYFTKWVEAIPLRKATGAAVANFIREHIITRFGIPYKLISDNGTPFINKDVRKKAYLTDVLWAYRNSSKTATSFTPFSLVYGTDTISPTELVVPSPRVMQGSELEVDANMCAEAWMANLEGLDEARELAKARSQRNYQKMAGVYSKALRVRVFVEGQMVLKAAEFVRRNLPSPSKFSPNWDGPYIIREAHGSGYYRLSKSDGTILVDPINGK